MKEEQTIVDEIEASAEAQAKAIENAQAIISSQAEEVSRLCGELKAATEQAEAAQALLDESAKQTAALQEQVAQYAASLEAEKQRADQAEAKADELSRTLSNPGVKSAILDAQMQTGAIPQAGGGEKQDIIAQLSEIKDPAKRQAFISANLKSLQSILTKKG
jgi:chromosome segregation ATPase